MARVKTRVEGTLIMGGPVSNTDTTEASSSTVAALKSAGGIAAAKKVAVGTDLLMVNGDIDMTTANTGVYDVVLKDNQADALSIRRATTDMMVFTSTAAGPKITTTPNVVSTGAITTVNRIYPKTTVTTLTTTTAGATYAYGAILGGVIADTPAGAATATTDTAANLVDNIPNAVDGSSFMFTVHNASGTHAITLAGGNNVTLVGTLLTVAAKNARTFLGVVVSAASKTITVYSLGTTVHTT